MQLRTAKTLWSFGHFEYNRVKIYGRLQRSQKTSLIPSPDISVNFVLYLLGIQPVVQDIITQGVSQW